MEENIKPFLENAAEILINSIVPEAPKKKRYIRRVTQACAECQKGHVSCDPGRPCQKCIERGRICIDGEPPKRRGRVRKKRESEEVSSDILQGLQHMNQTNPTLFNQMTSEDSSISDVMGILRDNSVINLPDSTVSIFADVFPMPFDQRPTNISAEEWLAKNLQKLIRRVKLLEDRIPHLAERVKPQARIIGNVLLNLQKQTRNQRTEELVAAQQIELPRCIEMYKDLTAPVMLWSSALTIEWVNDAFRNLTGFTTPLPDEELDLSLLEVM
eukprot:TRINITY_DN7_c0_g1_i4.p1 TRINITY_DN7_c0_g1~~TRINITY_DN7_c0_g1_i4.p1  ORF type:complete len:271 (-),score=62.49 TRINITY_DN7_c0_g1_i4:401-1213(-)